ncbi:MAG TPA: AraC family transcriptional regulator ligand-binding domain-containing protein [Candidatus Acidoferrales bacterium]|nr:AraC family transcriptional regulator ligand-binding domain-containing protein [Candidatus Acidoferrales bacterium]
MAAHDNSLTRRAKAQAGRWDAPARDVRVLVRGLERLGYNSKSLLAAAGLDSAGLDDPDAIVPCEGVGSMLAQAQQERFTPNLGLELAKLTTLGAYPLLDYLVLTSDTVGAGVRQLERYFRIAGNPVTLSIHAGRDPIAVEMTEAGAPFSVEYIAALMVLHFRAETGGKFTAAGIAFRHKPDDAGAFERALGCPVRAPGPWNGLLVPPDSWRLPLGRRDPVLREFLEDQAEKVLARLPAQTGIAADVQRALASRVGGPDTRIAAVARQLAISVRTLQRRLAAEGVSYQDLLDGARKEAAGQYLGNSTLAICEIAYLLGYSEPAPFHRAFKRWYGVTPDAFRRKP